MGRGWRGSGRSSRKRAKIEETAKLVEDGKRFIDVLPGSAVWIDAVVSGRGGVMVGRRWLLERLGELVPTSSRGPVLDNYGAFLRGRVRDVSVRAVHDGEAAQLARSLHCGLDPVVAGEVELVLVLSNISRRLKGCGKNEGSDCQPRRAREFGGAIT